MKHSLDKSEWERINLNRTMQGKLPYRSEQHWEGEQLGKGLGALLGLSIIGAKKYKQWRTSSNEAGFIEILGLPTIIALPISVFLLMNPANPPWSFENIVGSILFLFCLIYGGYRFVIFVIADGERRRNARANGTGLNSGGPGNTGNNDIHQN